MFYELVVVFTFSFYFFVRENLTLLSVVKILEFVNLAVEGYINPKNLELEVISKYRPGGVVASSLASHADDQGSILVDNRSVTKPW